MTRRALLLAALSVAPLGPFGLRAAAGPLRAAAGPLRAAAGPLRAPGLDDPGLPICRGGLRATLAAGAPAEAAEADYLEKLGLLEGHLLVGRRLLEANESRLAVPHFGHPIRELYTWLEPRLAAHRAPGFEAELEAMEAYAEGGGHGTGGRFAPAWASLQPKLAAAKAAVPPAMRDSPRFMLNHVAMMAYDVAGDYGESIERGRIVNIVEYHDSMGFLMYAAATAAAQRTRGGPAAPAWQEAEAVLEDLRKVAYPELLPSSRPATSVSGVRSRYDRIRAIAERVAA